MHLQIKVKRPPRFLEEGGDDSMNGLIEEIVQALRELGHEVDGISVSIEGDTIRLLPQVPEAQLFDQDDLVREIVAKLKDRHGNALDPGDADAHAITLGDFSELPAELARFATGELGDTYQIQSVVIQNTRKNDRIVVSVGLDKPWTGPED